ncbi:MAG: hypothetical protein JW797_15900 [Bradymonadales bacterium]|nr:hypothetical protein [Bradymonadales bacterium]
MGLVHRAAARVLTVMLLALVIGMGACKVTVEDFEKWRNRRGSEEQFIVWMLDEEASDAVRAKAVEMFFEQYNYHGGRALERVGDLPADRRHRAILDACPRIESLYQGVEYSLGGGSVVTLQPVRVRDGVITLLQVTQDEAVRTRLLELVQRWLEEHYRPCVTSVGRHPNSRVLSLVGAERGLPILVHYIREGSFDDLRCQASYLQDVTWSQQTADELAAAYIDRWERSRPADLQGRIDLVEVMVSVPGSQVLKSWIFQQLTSADSSLLANFVDAFLEYVRPLASPADIESYGRMLQIYHGNLRWISFEEMMTLGGAEGLDRALSLLPINRPSVGANGESVAAESIPWGLWGGEELDDGLKRAADYLCERPVLQEMRDQARPVLEQHGQSQNPVAQAIAIRCLAEVGGASTIEPLRSLLRDSRPIPAWGDQDNTIGALARSVMERLGGQ